MSFLDGVAFGGDQISARNEYDLSEFSPCINQEENNGKTQMRELQKAIHDLNDDYQSERNQKLRLERENLLRNKPETQINHVEGFSNKQLENKYLLILLIFICVICVVQYHQLQNISTQLCVLNHMNQQKT